MPGPAKILLVHGRRGLKAQMAAVCEPGLQHLAFSLVSVYQLIDRVGHRLNKNEWEEWECLRQHLDAAFRELQEKKTREEVDLRSAPARLTSSKKRRMRQKRLKQRLAEDY